MTSQNLHPSSFILFSEESLGGTRLRQESLCASLELPQLQPRCQVGGASRRDRDQRPDGGAAVFALAVRRPDGPPRRRPGVPGAAALRPGEVSAGLGPPWASQEAPPPRHRHFGLGKGLRRGPGRGAAGKAGAGLARLPVSRRSEERRQFGGCAGPPSLPRIASRRTRSFFLLLETV